MPSAIVRFRPTGPWRFGPDSGTRDRLDAIYHSDSLYAAVTSAMLRLELLEEWLDATARRQSEPEVRFSSLFPFQREILFVTPPRSLWPPPPSTKIRFKSARFVPLSVVRSLVAEQPIDENRWIIDGESECMIPSGEGPFRIGMRSAAAVDRIQPGALDPHITACLEFGRDAGLWTMVVFSSDEAQNRWRNRVRGALRLLADSGFGGERSRGWGRASDPEWQRCPDFWAAPDGEKGHWLLSVYAPADADGVDWKTGNYSTVTRTGRIESSSKWGALKTPTLMIEEGSVLVSPQAPRGGAPNVAPSDFAHPVYRAGFAVTIPIPWKPPGTPAPVFSAQKQVEATRPTAAAPAQGPSAPAEQPVPTPEATPAAAPPEPGPSTAAPEPGVRESESTEAQREPVPVEAEPALPAPDTAAEPEPESPEAAPTAAEAQSQAELVEPERADRVEPPGTETTAEPAAASGEPAHEPTSEEGQPPADTEGAAPGELIEPERAAREESPEPQQSQPPAPESGASEPASPETPAEPGPKSEPPSEGPSSKPQNGGEQ